MQTAQNNSAKKSGEKTRLSFAIAIYISSPAPSFVFVFHEESLQFLEHYYIFAFYTLYLRKWTSLSETKSLVPGTKYSNW